MIAAVRQTVCGAASYGRLILHMDSIPSIWMLFWMEMDVARPYAALCPTLDAGVLSVLAGTTRPLTGREIARLVGRRSHSGVLDTLDRLTEHGLVDREEAGRAFLFTLNREHLAAPAVDLLAQMRGELLDRLTHLVDSWKIRRSTSLCSVLWPGEREIRKATSTSSWYGPGGWSTRSRVAGATRSAGPQTPALDRELGRNRGGGSRGDPAPA